MEPILVPMKYKTKPEMKVKIVQAPLQLRYYRPKSKKSKSINIMDIGIEILIGKTLTQIINGDDQLTFLTDQGEKFLMLHEQDCCESVSIDDIVGDLNDLIGSPILSASEDSNSDNPKSAEYDDSCTWTFYNISTVKGHVTIKWYGTSNGYYSESVSLIRAEA